MYPRVLWDPSVDPMKLPYKRSMCPQPPLPTVRPLLLFLTRPCVQRAWVDKASVAWAGEHGLVADGVVEPPNAVLT